MRASLRIASPAAGVPGGTPIEDTPIMTWMPYAFYLTNAGPSLTGLLMTLLLYGLPGVRRLAFQLTPWSVGRAWPVLAVCLFLPLGVIVLPLVILAALGTSVPPPSWPGSHLPLRRGYRRRLDRAGAVRGNRLARFALPHLQRRHSALISSLIIGLVWAFWHWPNFVIPSESPPWWHLLAFVPMTMAVSVVFTWVYNSTGGSLFAVVLLHGAIYTALGLCPSPDSRVAAREDVIFLLLFAVIAVGLVWRYGAANLSWR